MPYHGSHSHHLRTAPLTVAIPSLESPRPRPAGPPLHPTPHVPWSVSLSQTIGKRKSQEDVGIVVQLSGTRGEALITGVADGHGGIDGALYSASALTRETLRKLRARHGTWTGPDLTEADLRETMEATFVSTDELLLDYLSARNATNSGSTATLVVLSQGQGGRGEGEGEGASTSGGTHRRLVVANVGDSHCVLSRGGRAVTLTRGHRVHGPGEDVEEEKRRVTQLGGWISRGRVCGIISVSRSLGDPRFKGRDANGLARDLESLSKWRGTAAADWARKAAEGLHCEVLTARPDVVVIDLTPKDDHMIVASDGFWDVVEPQAAVGFVSARLQEGFSQQEICDALVKWALQAGSRDNITAILVLCNNNGRLASSSEASAGSESEFGLPI